MIYLASPYTHQSVLVRIRRFELAEQYTAEQLQQRVWIFSPIVYAHEMAKSYNFPFDARYWQEFNYNMLRRADAVQVLLLDGWEESTGVADELELAQRLFIPVEMVAWPI